MARQKLMVGTYGEISCVRLKNGSWQARARYCDVDGVVRQYRKNGETKTKATANLKSFFVEHTGTFGDGAIAPDDTVQDLLDLWFLKMEQADGGPRPETLGYYRSHVRWVLDPKKTDHPLGAYQLRHVRPVIIQAALDSAGVSPDMRAKIRSVLVRAFNLAIFHEAINGNPASAVPSVPLPRSKKKPVPVEDLDAVRAAIREWANAEKRNGPKSVDLPDIVEMLIATGMRIGELLALRWSDIELTPPPERPGRRGLVPMVDGERPDHLEGTASRLREDGRRAPPHRTPGLGRRVAAPAEGRPTAKRPRRGVHHPQRHLALPDERAGPTVVHPPPCRLRRHRGAPGCLAPLVQENRRDRDRRGV